MSFSSLDIKPRILSQAEIQALIDAAIAAIPPPPDPDQIQESNVVYLDKNFSEMTIAAMLAYETLEECVDAWRPGGDAYVAFGAPSATNPAVIRVGAGVFVNTATVTLDVPYLTIQGISEEASEIKSDVSDLGNLLLIQERTVNLRNLSLNGAGVTAFEIYIDIDAVVGVFDHVTFRNGAQSNISFSGNAQNWDGVISNCTFLTGGDHNMIMTGLGHSMYGKVQDCDFHTATGYYCFTYSIDLYTEFKRCKFVKGSGGQPGYAVFYSQTEGVLHGVLEDCYFLNQRTDSSGIVLRNNTTDGVVTRCRVIGNGTGLAVDDFTDAPTFELTHCVLRLPTGGSPGDSVSSTIVNTAISGGMNEELPSNIIA